MTKQEKACTAKAIMKEAWNKAEDNYYKQKEAEASRQYESRELLMVKGSALTEVMATR